RGLGWRRRQPPRRRWWLCRAWWLCPAPGFLRLTSSSCHLISIALRRLISAHDITSTTVGLDSVAPRYTKRANERTARPQAAAGGHYRRSAQLPPRRRRIVAGGFVARAPARDAAVRLPGGAPRLRALVG